MAENTLLTRIKLKYDTLTNWNNSSLVLKAGEAAVAYITANGNIAGTSDTSQTNTPRAVGIKIGDGTHTFANLPWVQAVAADVYDWAKTAQKPTYQASEISGLADYISGEISDSNTTYQIIAGTGTNANKWILQGKEIGGNWTNVSTIDLSTIFSDVSSLKTKVGDSTVAAQVQAGIDDLNVTDSAVANQFVTAVSETKGKISITRAALTAAAIPNIGAGKITSGTLSVARGGTGASTLASGEVLIGNGTSAVSTKAIDSTITDASTSTNLVTSAAVAAYVDSKTASITGAMHFKGVSTTAITDGGTQDPTIGGSKITTKEQGDVVLYGSQEFVWAGEAWELLGDEGSYALKTITVTGSDGLTGGGDLSANRAISHATPSGASAGTKSGDDYIKTITTDKFGHVTGYTTGTDSDTTYTFASGTKKGAFSVTPDGGTAQSVDIYGLQEAAYRDIYTGQYGWYAWDAGLDGSIAGQQYEQISTSSTDKVAMWPVVNAFIGKINTEIRNMAAALDPIAYDGEVKNLKQTDDTILVFDCGNATTVI